MKASSGVAIGVSCSLVIVGFAACSYEPIGHPQCSEGVPYDCPGFGKDAGTDAADARRDTGYVIDTDAGAVDATPPGADFEGQWDPLPGLEAYPVWVARDVATSIKPLTWGPCSPVSEGCQELVVDWTPERGR